MSRQAQLRGPTWVRKAGCTRQIVKQQGGCTHKILSIGLLIEHSRNLR